MMSSAKERSPIVRGPQTAARSYLLQFAAALPASMRAQRVLIALILAYWVAGLIVAYIAGRPSAATITTYLPSYIKLMPIMLGSLIVCRAIQIMIVDRPARPLSQLLHEIRTKFASPQSLAHALPLLVGMLAFGGSFTLIKASITDFMPFSWDPVFERWDRWLHGGVAPWELLQSIFGTPLATYLLAWAYTSWFYVLSLIWLWQILSMRDERLRMQFVLSLLLSWILLGNILATLLASAGPCYFGKVTGLPDPYLPQLIYLIDSGQDEPLWIIGAQRFLWHNYVLRELTFGAGISAMPSMHVALSTLFALVCWRTNRWLGLVMCVYAVIIMIGSVHLAWHYAVDGYVGAAGVLIIWWVVGRVLDWRAAARLAPSTAEVASYPATQ